MPKHRNVQFYERIVWQHCVYALARFRNKDHLVRVRKGSSFGFTNLSFHHKHSWTYPYIDVKTANVVTATNVETQSRTVVTGLPGFSPLTPPSSFPSPDKKSGHKHVLKICPAQGTYICDPISGLQKHYLPSSHPADWTGCGLILHTDQLICALWRVNFPVFSLLHNILLKYVTLVELEFKYETLFVPEGHLVLLQQQ